MERIWITVLNMSLTSGIIILAVLLVRLFLCRGPRIFSYLLWLAVLFRLLIPFSFSMNVSLMGMLKAPFSQQGQIRYIPEDIGLMERPRAELPGKEVTGIVNSSLPAGTEQNSMNPMQGYLAAGAFIWLTGMLVMFLYSAIQGIKLYKKLKGAERQEKGIYRTDKVPMPFVCGLLRPRIYLPAALEEKEEEYILLHERIHIRRGDLLWRSLGYLALCIHWFNPLVWAAFFLSGRDMEMSCDEAVIRRLGEGVKKEYSASLLSIACGRRIIPGGPLAFGEGETGSRIRNLFRYKKTGRKVMAALGIICVGAMLLFLANPAGKGGLGERFSCCRIPVAEGRLSWGMDQEEIKAVLGEPSYVKNSSGGATLVYESLTADGLGNCSQVEIYVGDQNMVNREGTRSSSGLCGLMMVVDETTREKVLESMQDFYGAFSPEGGSTVMEAQLQQGVADFFDEVYFREEWRVRNLSEEEYRGLNEIWRLNSEGRPLDQDSLLMSIDIRGVESKEAYPCRIQLDITVFGVLSYLLEAEGDAAL